MVDCLLSGFHILLECARAAMNVTCENKSTAEEEEETDTKKDKTKISDTVLACDDSRDIFVDIFMRN